MKARITVVFEYEINPKYYMGMTDFAEMLEKDLHDFRDEPELILDLNYDFNITGELIR